MGCRLEKSPMDVEEYLGTEHGAAIVSTTGLLRPGVVASAGETVRRGGFLAIAAPPRDSWNPGPAGGLGYYKRYLYNMIPRAASHLWLDLDECKAYSRSGPPPPTEIVEWKPERVPAGVNGRIYRLAKTQGQARLIEEFHRMVRGRVRSLYIIGDRGRGKSYATGLGLADAVASKAVGRVEVTAPTLAQAQQVFQGLLDGLRAAGILGRPGVRVRLSGRGWTIRVTGPWFRVSYEPPWSSGGAPLVIVDEAAAVGVARVRRIAWRSGRTVATTTLHGYEGSGRTFAHMVDEILPKPRVTVELAEPVRYLPGDPLEEWLYKTFMLDAEPEGPRSVESVDYSMLRAGGLAGDPGLLRRVYSILVLAHYRNTPDDLMAILESPHYTVHALTADGWPVAVALVAWESWSMPPESRIALEKLALYTRRAERIESARIVRIAVLPWLQRRGLGSRLLRHIEDWAVEHGASVVTTIFSRHEVIGFWRVNGYLYYYASPRYNRVTGEKNLAAAKGLTVEGRETVEEASGEFRARLILAAHTVYRDLAAEKIVEILSATKTPRDPPLLQPSPSMLSRLEECADGRLDPEQAIDAMFLAYASTLLQARVEPSAETVYLVARLLQGKPHDEASRLAGLGEEEAYQALREACRRLYTIAFREGRTPGSNA